MIEIRPIEISFSDLFSRQTTVTISGSFEITAKELYDCLPDATLRNQVAADNFDPLIISHLVTSGLPPASEHNTSPSTADAAALSPVDDSPYQSSSNMSSNSSEE